MTREDSFLRERLDLFIGGCRDDVCLEVDTVSSQCVKRRVPVVADDPA